MATLEWTDIQLIREAIKQRLQGIRNHKILQGLLLLLEGIIEEENRKKQEMKEKALAYRLEQIEKRLGSLETKE